MTDSHDGGTEPRQHDLPLPQPASVKYSGYDAGCYFSELQMLQHASNHHANEMRKLREAQALSDERIEEVAGWFQSEVDHEVQFDCRAFAHAITDPLLAEIAELEKHLAGAQEQAGDYQRMANEMEQETIALWGSLSRSRTASAASGVLRVVERRDGDHAFRQRPRDCHRELRQARLGGHGAYSRNLRSVERRSPSTARRAGTAGSCCRAAMPRMRLRGCV
jgi:hypothetical protein